MQQLMTLQAIHILSSHGHDGSSSSNSARAKGSIPSVAEEVLQVLAYPNSATTLQGEISGLIQQQQKWLRSL